MSHELIFTIIPFNPIITPDVQIDLSIDLSDIARQLRDKFPEGEIVVKEGETQRCVLLYISTKTQGIWNIATYIEDYSQFCVNGWPKSIAKDIILWYRKYIPSSYPLFLVIPESGYVTELVNDLHLDDIEGMYPFPVSDDV